MKENWEGKGDGGEEWGFRLYGLASVSVVSEQYKRLESCHTQCQVSSSSPSQEVILLLSPVMS